MCRFLGVPPGRGSCPLTGPLPFDLIYTDYHGLQQMKQHMGLSLRKHKSVFLFLFFHFATSVCLLHPLRLPVIASLMKYFAIGILTGRRHRPVNTGPVAPPCISTILLLGGDLIWPLYADQCIGCRLLGWCHLQARLFLYPSLRGSGCELFGDVNCNEMQLIYLWMLKLTNIFHRSEWLQAVFTHSENGW